VVFLYLASRLWKGVLRLVVGRNSSSCRVVRRQSVPLFEEHRLLSIAVDVSYGGWAVVENPVFFVYLSSRLWKGVLRLAVRENSISGRYFRSQRLPVFEGQRLPSTGSRWDIRWVSGRGITWFFVYLM
jgi:hypothetical protein